MLLDLIENRKSIRNYSNKDIPIEDLKKVLKAGYLAPSWMNSQPWKFILVKNPDTKKVLSKLAQNQPHVANANAVIVCVADLKAWDKKVFGEVLKKRGMSEQGIDNVLSVPIFYPPLLGENATLLRTVEQVTYAVSYMMLEAKELGIDSCIIGAISNLATVYQEEIATEVNQKLNLEETDVVITMITLGYAAKQEPIDKQRKEFDEVVYFEKVGQSI